ncbi:SMI1/KNR4 family protein [Pseudoalteromonas sp. N1230-9]|uniref:SMI1/KNR4 family protein n=1 Tax=Pseudoalteromonas sp. N1230-9 TaxID=2907156 RepID=UPI002B2B7962|nr:SMI1/KNR4 family protein [Pseudoalteromonas sp. N1230-9]
MFEVIERLISQAASKKNFTQRGNVANEEVRELETELSITLPSDFKYFLLNYGYCFWFGEVICGLVGENKRYEKLCGIIRKNTYYQGLYNDDPAYQSVPSEGIVIGTYDGGGYYFLFSQESERAGEVGLFLTETYGQEVSKFKSFTDYLSYLVTGSPDPEPVDVDYDKIMNIIED